MDVRKQAGLWLAAVVVCFAGWGLRDRFVGDDGAAVSAMSPVRASPPPLRLPADLATIGTQQPIELNAAMARRAVRDGVLRIAAPDGTTYPVRVDRQYTDATGHWHVLGNATTAAGRQAMVLTFGANAVFGIIPKPDGTLLQVTTCPGGKVSIAAAGDLVPPVPGAQDHTDIRSFRKRPSPMLLAKPAQAAPHAAAGQPTPVSAPAPNATPVARTAPIATTAIASAAPVDMTPVRIDVLALYTQDLVTLRGSKSAAETEVANLFAIANQAHAASGTRVTLNPVGVQQVTVPVGTLNTDAIDQATQGKLGLDTEALRDTYSADLVTIIRPYTTDDFSCGVAWLEGEGMQRNNGLSAENAYSVVNVAPCDPYVLAHELGHLMGSTHDRDSSTDPNTGALDYGAYAFSFGHRTRAARTIMAYSSGQPRIGYFSNPAIIACGTACGIDERMDNVRSINLMAPSIAAFRGPKGTASISDVEVVERTANHAQTIYVPVRLSAPAPDGATFDVQVTGGTATRDVDYTIGSDPVSFWSGSRVASIRLDVRGDDDIEPDETIQLRLTPHAGTSVPVADANATVTIVADDPRPIVTGKLWFAPGLPVEGKAPILKVYGADGVDDPHWETLFVNPDNSYTLPVAFGSPLHLEYYQDSDYRYAMQSARVQELRGDREVPLLPRDTHVVSGRVRFAPGTTPPDTQWSLRLDVRETTNGVERYRTNLYATAPDYRFSTPVAAGASLEINYTGEGTPGLPKSWQGYLQNINGDVTFDPLLSTLPSLLVYGPQRAREGEPLSVVVQLSEDATGPGVGFRYRTVDGTALSGVDYTAATGTARIAAGEYYRIIDLKVRPNNKTADRPKYFDVVIDQVSGATASTATVRMWISDDDRRTGGPLAGERQ